MLISEIGEFLLPQILMADRKNTCHYNISFQCSEPKIHIPNVMTKQF